MIRIIFSIMCTALFFGCGSDANDDDDPKDTNAPDASDGTDGTDGTGNTDGDTEEYPEPDKICALSFDDGPENTKTNEVLDKLEFYGVTASFFVIGQKLSSSTEETVKRAVSLGCDIENHSWSYSDMKSMSAEDIEKSVNDTTAAIEEYAGVSPHFFRPPNLSTSATMYDTIPYPFISGVTGNDWESSATPESIAKKILDGVWDGSIILLHDNQSFNPHPTIEALDTIIPGLKKEGYEIVTVKELFERKDVDPASKESGMWTRVQ